MPAKFTLGDYLEISECYAGLFHFTKGPWQIATTDSDEYMYTITSSDESLNNTICHVKNKGFLDTKDNARLISAAPDLHEACLRAKMELTMLYALLEDPPERLFRDIKRGVFKASDSSALPLTSIALSKALGQSSDEESISSKVRECPVCEEECGRQDIQCDNCGANLVITNNSFLYEREDDAPEKDKSLKTPRLRLILSYAAIFLGFAIGILLACSDLSTLSTFDSLTYDNVMSTINQTKLQTKQPYIWGLIGAYIVWSFYWGVQVMGKECKLHFFSKPATELKFIYRIVIFLVYFVFITPIFGFVIGCLGGAIYMQIRCLRQVR